jgi:hypothetical protein
MTDLSSVFLLILYLCFPYSFNIFHFRCFHKKTAITHLFGSECLSFKDRDRKSRTDSQDCYEHLMIKSIKVDHFYLSEVIDFVFFELLCY